MGPTPPRIFTVPEAAAHLRVSRAFLYKLIAAGDLRPFKLGSRTLTSATELDRFVHAAEQRGAA